jgi:hypothetical protein
MNGNNTDDTGYKVTLSSELPKDITLNYTNLHELPPEFRADFEEDPDYEKKMFTLLNAGAPLIFINGKLVNEKGLNE